MAHLQPRPTAPQPQQQQPRQQPPQNPYPPRTSITATIFTPISGDDLTAPFNPPSNRMDLLHSKIAALNENAKHVRNNMLAFMRHECLRILWDANNEATQLKAMGQEDKVNEVGSEIASEEELDYMIERMMAQGGGQANDTERPVENPNFQGLLKREGISFRERYTLCIEQTIGKGLFELDGYEKHVEKVRQGYIEALERERQRDNAMDLD